MTALPARRPQHTSPARPCRRARRRRTRKRHPYGINTAGAYAGITAWCSRERWLAALEADLHTEEVRALRAQVGTRGPVSIRACHALAVALAACADGCTGRNAMPGNTALTTQPGELHTDAPDDRTKLAAATGYSITTVQKAEQVLVARGWLVRIRTGKNWLTRTERRELHAAGSRARQRRNVWACTLPKHTRPASPVAVPVDDVVDDVVDHSVDNSPATRGTDAGCDLPTTQRVSGSVSVPANKIFKPQRASRTAPAGRPPSEAVARKRAYQTDWRTVRLAKDLRARISWLRPVPHQRIMPPLARFATAGWTAADIQNALDTLLATRGWRVPDSRTTHGGGGDGARSYPMRSPWAYLAMLLRGLEPTDLIARRDHERVLADYQELLRTGPECPHGQPGGDTLSPTKSILACPLCRRACSAAS